MNILLITPWLPWPPHDGARIRLFETLRYLSTRHQITLLATVAHAHEAQHAAALQKVCTRVETTVLLYDVREVVQRLAHGVLLGLPLIQSAYYDTKLAQRVRTLTTEAHYDIVQIEHSYAARYIRAISPQ
jgi:hypothetical protein